jgi:serine/threonine protein kinase
VIGLRVDSYTIETDIGRGHSGSTFRATNRIGKPLALKLIPCLHYQKLGKSFDEEIRRYKLLGSHPNIADLLDAGTVDVRIQGVTLTLYFVVMEWIDGVTLTKYLQSSISSTAEIFGVVLDVLSGLERCATVNLWHNDLNSDNILLKRMTDEERLTRRIESPFLSKIVDFGSLVYREGQLSGRLSDLKFLGVHLNELIKTVLSKSPILTKEDRFCLTNLETIVARLADESPDRGLTDVKDAIKEVDDLYQQRFLLSESHDVRLKNPFLYLDANGFPNDAFINYLFSDNFPWLRDIASPEIQATLITGPRGSGKTMLLRSMRLKTRLHPFSPGESTSAIIDRLKADQQIAFYVSARIEIGNHCILSKLPRWAQTEELVIYYFFLLYAVEVLETLYLGVAKRLFPISAGSEANICRFISTSLWGISTHTFASCLRSAREMQHTLVSDVLGKPPEGTMLTSRFLSELTQQVKSLAPFFANKPVAYLLDDFSAPKIPDAMQRVLLPIIWNPGGGYSFRVSAHSESVATEDVRHNHYEVNRDFREVNLGQYYLNSIDIDRNERTIEADISDIFLRRFRASEKFEHVTLTGFLGPEYAGNFGREIRERSGRKAARGVRYFGSNTLVKLCSGDISYLIDMVGRMFGEQTGIPIKQSTQHRVIRQYAWKQLYRLNDYQQAPCNLYECALNFGKLSLLKLLGDEVKEKDEGRPAEYLRIEVAFDDQIEKIRPIIAELLRAGVFVDGGFSNSSQGIPARRLLFRKIFTPAFPTTYNSRDTFAWSARRFLEFVEEPERFLRRSAAEQGVKPDDQLTFINSLARPAS